MFLRMGAERILNFASLKDGEPSFAASVGLQIKGANGDLLPYDIVVERDLEDVFGSAFGVVQHRRV